MQNPYFILKSGWYRRTNGPWPVHINALPDFSFPQVVLRALLPALLVSGSTLATSNKITWLVVDTAAQTAYVDLDADLGFPIGTKSLILTISCKQPGVSVYPGPRADLPTRRSKWKPDPVLLKSLVKIGLVQRQSGHTTIVNTVNHDRLSLDCSSGILTTDFSTMNLIGFEDQVDGPFYRNTSEPSINVTLALSFYPDSATPLLNAQVRVQKSAGGYVFTRLQVDPPLGDAAARAQVFMSDGKSLYPLYYNAQPQDNAQLAQVVLGGQIDIYEHLT